MFMTVISQQAGGNSSPLTGDIMAPTQHPISSSSQRRSLGRADRRSGHGMRTRIRVPHARITFAESPELYLREEMS